MAERIIDIVIRGKNLTAADFAAARKELRDLEKANGEVTKSSTLMGQAFKAFGPALGVAAITSAAMKVLDYAGTINDLAAQTGLTTRAIQEMSHAAKMTGTSLESFTNAAFKLGTNLAGGEASVVGAVEKLGLSYEALRKQSPDEQFNTITTALGGVENAQERNKIAVELFGKTAKEILPAIAQGYDQLASSAIIAGDGQLQALDMAGDALDSFYEGVLSLGTQLAGGFIIAVREANREIFSQLSMVKEVRKGFAAWGDVLDTFGVTSTQLPKVFNASRVAAANLPEPIKAVSMSLQEQDRITKSLDTRIRASIETKKAFAEAEKKAKSAADAFAASVQRLDTAEFFVEFKKPISELSRELEELPSSAAIAMNGLARFKDGVNATNLAAQTLGASIKAGLSGVLATVPGTLARAFEGGGNWLGAAKSIGSQFGSTIGTTIGKSFASLGSLGGPIGSAIGSLVGPLIGKISSLFTSKNTQEVRAYNVEIGKVRDALLSTYGPLDDLERKAQTVGLSFKEAWGHQGKAGLEAMNTLAKELKDRLTAVAGASQNAIGGFEAVATGMTKPWQEFGVKLDASRASVLAASNDYETLKASGTATADQLAAAADKVKQAGAYYEFLAGAQRDMAVTGKQQLADLGVQAIGTFGAAMMAGKSYNDALIAVGPSLTTLGQSYKSLGLNVEDTGLKHLILQATVAKGAPELIAAAGGLGSSMQGLAQLGMLNADTFAAMQRTGSAMYSRLQSEVGALGGDSRDALLPMQDYLHQASIQAELLGLPLDDNTQLLIAQSKELGIWKDKGKSAQDLLIEGMGKLVDKVGTLIDRLLGVTNAINTIPTQRTVTIEAQYIDPGMPEGFGGGRIDGGGERGFARGTFGMTGSDFPDFGSGQRVIAHGREAIVPYADREETARRWLGESGPAPRPVVNLTVNVDKDGTATILGELDVVRVVQSAMQAGQIAVPQRAVSARSR